MPVALPFLSFEIADLTSSIVGGVSSTTNFLVGEDVWVALGVRDLGGSRDGTGSEVLGKVLPEFFGWANQFLAVLDHFRFSQKAKFLLDLSIFGSLVDFLLLPELPHF